MSAVTIVSEAVQLDYPVQDYITGIFSEPDPDDDPVEFFIRPLLESEAVAEAEIEAICARLQAMWDAQIGNAHTDAAVKLDKVLDMRRQEHLAKRQTVTQVVDIASVVKVPFSFLRGARPHTAHTSFYPT